MSIPRWTPNQEPTRQEQLILKRLKRVRKLFAFLRRHRHELFDGEFQDELESMYRKCGAGQKPLPLPCLPWLFWYRATSACPTPRWWS